MARRRAANDCSGPGVQRGIQREGAMAVVFESMSLSSSGRQRQHWIQAVQCLDARLLINAENDRMLRRFHIQANNISRLPLKVRILGHHVALEALRLQSRSLPNPSHHHVMHPKVLGQFARAPMGRAIGRRTLRPGQNPGFHFRGPFFHCSTRMARVQSSQPILQKALLPTHNESRVAGQFFLDHLVGLSFSQHQQQTRAPHFARRQGARTSTGPKFLFFGGSQLNRFIGHAS
jgi:hypothetical protein